ncbi:MAG: initiation control protein YabA [Limosilactobacillus sp.]|uniref:initiation control protein YabA n=1 Tax=Limosilactobacillus sp. TaxID=2773925 RepID=UPI00270F64C2|nr:initiation control protein YabA [Limosilactobacillus sp.]
MNEDEQRNSIYDNLNKFSHDLTEMTSVLESLKSQLNTVLAQNAELTIENRHLQEAIKKLRGQNGEQELSTGRKTLKELYQQGFHVCRKHFGERLDANESCIFCDEAIFSGMDN